MMLRKLGIAAAVLALFGCAPQKSLLYYKQGSVFAAQKADYEVCKREGFSKYPRDLMTTYNPDSFTPGGISCYTIGMNTQCREADILGMPGSVATTDINEGARALFIDDCMKEKGYRVVKVRNCKPGESGYNAAMKAPPLDQIKCFERHSSPRLK